MANAEAAKVELEGSIGKVSARRVFGPPSDRPHGSLGARRRHAPEFFFGDAFVSPRISMNAGIKEAKDVP